MFWTKLNKAVDPGAKAAFCEMRALPIASLNRESRKWPLPKVRSIASSSDRARSPVARVGGGKGVAGGRKRAAVRAEARVWRGVAAPAPPRPHAGGPPAGAVGPDEGSRAAGGGRRQSARGQALYVPGEIVERA